MGWLRRKQDCIGLALAWALLLHAAILGLSSATHAAALTGGEPPILCTKDGFKQEPQPSHQKHGCECCLTSCRMACGAAKANLPDRGLHPFPPAEFVWLIQPETAAPAAEGENRSEAQPRAPPIV
jgi:hypothetical protein